MKKTLAASLALMTVVLSCAGCQSAVKPHITIETSESEAEPTVTEPLQTAPSVTMDITDDTPDETENGGSSDNVVSPSEFPTGFIANSNLWVDISTIERDSGVSVFYVPKLRADSEDATDINQAISDLIGSSMQDEECTGSDFIYFENSEDIFSFLIMVHYSSGRDVYKCVTYNKEENVRLTNEDIMAFAGIDEGSLYDTAAAAVRQVLSSRAPSGEVLFENGELNPDSTLGQAVSSSDEASSAYYSTFAESTLSSEMPMFLNDKGEICFCSDVMSATGDTSFTEAYSMSGTAYRGITDDRICGSASMLDINADGVKEYIESSGGNAVVYRINVDSKEEILAVGSSSLRMTSAYFFEESGFESRPVLRADLASDESSASYEIITVSSDYSEIESLTLTWNDRNGDGLISEEDSFLINGDLSSYSEWYDLTGIG